MHFASRETALQKADAAYVSFHPLSPPRTPKDDGHF